MEEILLCGDANVRPWNTHPTTSTREHQNGRIECNLRPNMRTMNTRSERHHILMKITTIRRILSQLIRLAEWKGQHKFHTCIERRILHRQQPTQRRGELPVDWHRYNIAGELYRRFDRLV